LFGATERVPNRFRSLVNLNFGGALALLVVVA
jgi:hypothetical protein